MFFLCEGGLCWKIPKKINCLTFLPRAALLRPKIGFLDHLLTFKLNYHLDDQFSRLEGSIKHRRFKCHSRQNSKIPPSVKSVVMLIERICQSSMSVSRLLRIYVVLICCLFYLQSVKKVWVKIWAANISLKCLKTG